MILGATSSTLSSHLDDLLTGQSSQTSAAVTWRQGSWCRPVSRAPELLHGKTSLVQHDGRGVFQDLPSPFTATRYHSLAVEPETVGEDLEVTATTASGVIMGIRHTSHPVRGVQFHPESVLTEHGHHLLANWLVECGEQDAVASAAGLSPLLHV